MKEVNTYLQVHCAFFQKSLKGQKAFDFDEWCKEIDQHPAFMTELMPDRNGEFSEAVQALQVNS